MMINNYATLSQAVQDFWARSDLGAPVDYFIQLAEDTIYNDILRGNDGRGIAPLEQPLTGTINATTGTLAVPADYLALRNAQIVLNGGAYPLQRKNVEFIYLNYPDQQATDAPAFIARQGSNFIFGPFPDSAYAVQGTYWNRPAALSSSNPTTWMLSKCASMLLAACNVAAAMYLQDDQGVQRWQQLYAAQMASLLGQYKAEDWSGSSLAMTPA